MRIFSKIYFLLFSVFLVANVLAQAPQGYYNSADGKSKAALKTSLYNIIRTHNQLEYYSSSTYFFTTDWHPDGYLWDMYSNNKRSSWYGMNREHSMPKSWWSATPENTVAYSDLHNLYPSDAVANSEKLNYPLGEVTGLPKYENGVIKVGTNGFQGYNGLVFEPADEYKGDFARDYMYVVTCYENYANNWRSTGTASMLMLGTYPVFQTWAVNLLLKWHRNDPVSMKEINRNNAIFTFQNNRNPFIDYPLLAEFIWGKYVGENWALDGTLPEVDTALEVYFKQSDDILLVKLNKPSEATYFIYSINGVELKTGKPNADGSIVVGDLDDGMYIMKIFTGSKRKVAKFIIQHT